MNDDRAFPRIDHPYETGAGSQVLPHLSSLDDANVVESVQSSGGCADAERGPTCVAATR